MSAEPPPGGVALIRHLHGSETDLIDRCDVPAQMMQAWPARLRERYHVMVAAMNTVHESDSVARSIGETEANNIVIKRDSSTNIARKHKDMGKSTRSHEGSI